MPDVDTGYRIREGSRILVERRAAQLLRVLAAVEFAHACDMHAEVTRLLAGVDYAEVRLVADELACVSGEQMTLAVGE
jgi:hypothetical protein